VTGDVAYDEIADWYVSWVGEDPGFILKEAPRLLADRLAGARVLDAACGQGRVARALARQGAAVVGVDVSRRLVALAEAAESADPLGVRYTVGDLADPASWWDGSAFDGAVCEMALMDIRDHEATLAGIAHVLRPGGWFVTSLVHPCFPGNARGLPSWSPEGGYSVEGWWHSVGHNPDGVRIRVGAHHRTLASYLNALTGAGLVLDQAVEPPADVPSVLILACRRR
jgi:2-polyprenyl-3-methyl-5-hydroxy-6-metoxy-1,4-benzoquinol methylase